MAKQWGIERCKDSLIAGSAIPNFATGFDWYSQGTIFRKGELGSIVEIRRIRGNRLGGEYKILGRLVGLIRKF